jgi:hypothetical protein
MPISVVRGFSFLLPWADPVLSCEGAMSRKPSRSSSPESTGKIVSEKITRTSADLPEQPLVADLMGSLASTLSGPAHVPRVEGGLLPDHPSLAQLLAQKLGSQRLAASMPANLAKPGEFGDGAPPTGQAIVPAADVVTASTVQEQVESDKVGEGRPPCATNLTAVRSPPTRGCRSPTTRTR